MIAVLAHRPSRSMPAAVRHLPHFWWGICPTGHLYLFYKTLPALVSEGPLTLVPSLLPLLRARYSPTTLTVTRALAFEHTLLPLSSARAARCLPLPLPHPVVLPPVTPSLTFTSADTARVA